MEHEIDVMTAETMWLHQEYDAINVKSADQAKKLIEAIRKAAAELGWEV